MHGPAAVVACSAAAILFEWRYAKYYTADGRLCGEGHAALKRVVEDTIPGRTGKAGRAKQLVHASRGSGGQGRGRCAHAGRGAERPEAQRGLGLGAIVQKRLFAFKGRSSAQKRLGNEQRCRKRATAVTGAEGMVQVQAGRQGCRCEHFRLFI